MTHYINAKLTIERLNGRGEGVAHFNGQIIDVPYAIAGDEISAEIDGARGYIGTIDTPSPDRVPAFCEHYTLCGGCVVQALHPKAYAQWKRDLVKRAMRKMRIEAPIAEVIDAHGQGRRRVTFHARYVHGLGPMRIEVGFMKARAHDIVPLDHCPLLSPALNNALPVARAVAFALRGISKPLDIQMTQSDTGLDVDIRGCGPLDEAARRHLLSCADEHDLARISNHGVIILERRTPIVHMGEAIVPLPAGGFLQATVKGEEVLASLVCNPIHKARRIVDLFAGCGTLTLRLAQIAEVFAVEADEAALKALKKAAHHTPSLRPVHAEQRDLFARPLSTKELASFDVVVFDPPRAGAEAQARELARSDVPLIIAVSCNVQSLARDARLLIDGGYHCELITPVDQFRHSSHIECVALFRKALPARKRGRLLG